MTASPMDQDSLVHGPSASADGLAGLPPEGATRGKMPTLLSWAVGIPLGLGIGFLCRFALIYSWYSVQAVAAEAGWTTIDITLVRDGLLILFLGTGIAWLAALVVGVPATWFARRATNVPGRTWWGVALLLWITPFLALDLPRLLTWH